MLPWRRLRRLTLQVRQRLRRRQQHEVRSWRSQDPGGRVGIIQAAQCRKFSVTRLAQVAVERVPRGEVLVALCTLELWRVISSHCRRRLRGEALPEACTLVASAAKTRKAGNENSPLLRRLLLPFRTPLLSSSRRSSGTSAPSTTTRIRQEDRGHGSGSGGDRAARRARLHECADRHIQQGRRGRHGTRGHHPETQGERATCNC